MMVVCFRSHQTQQLASAQVLHRRRVENRENAFPDRCAKSALINELFKHFAIRERAFQNRIVLSVTVVNCSKRCLLTFLYVVLSRFVMKRLGSNAVFAKHKTITHDIGYRGTPIGRRQFNRRQKKVSIGDKGVYRSAAKSMIGNILLKETSS